MARTKHLEASFLRLSAPGSLRTDRSTVSFSTATNATITRRTVILAALSVAGMWHAACAREKTDDLNTLFELGSKSTPSAVAETKRFYDSLKRSRAADPRIDYAYAVVLVNQKQHREAIAVFTKYIDSSGAERRAYFLKMWTEVLLKRYAEALEDAKAFSERFPVYVPGSEDHGQDSAREMGKLFAYLEQVQPTTLKFKPIAEAQDQVLLRLGDHYAPAFAEGRRLVAEQKRELQAQQETKHQERIAKLQSRQKQNKSAAEEAKAGIDAKEETKKISEERVQEIRLRYTQLQSQVNPLASELQSLRRRLAHDKSSLQIEKKNRNSSQARIQNLNAEISALESEIRKLDARLAPLLREAIALEVEAGQELRTFEQADDAAQKNSKRAAAAEYQLRREQEKLKSPAKPLDEKMKALSSYVPFPYEQEKQRILSWFSN